jgi:hypothetical protein
MKHYFREMKCQQNEVRGIFKIQSPRRCCGCIYLLTPPPSPFNMAYMIIAIHDGVQLLSPTGRGLSQTVICIRSIVYCITHRLLQGEAAKQTL